MSYLSILDTSRTGIESWRTVPLGEVANIVSGFCFPKTLQGNQEGDLPFFKVGDISAAWNSGQKLLSKAAHYISKDQAKSIKAKTFPAGTVVFAKIGEAIRLNRRALLRIPSIVDNNVMGLVPRPGVDELYLYYWTLTIRLGEISQATTVPSVRKSDVEQLDFPLAPIEQQKSIVAEIEKQFSRLDEAVTSLKRTKANLKRYKAAVLKAAVEGKLTEEWRKKHSDVEPASKLLERILAERRAKWNGRGKYQEPVASDNDSLPTLPKGWIWAPLEAISDAVGGFAFESKKFTSTGYQVLKMANIRMGRIDLGQKPSFIQDVEDNVIAKYGLLEGDLVVTLTGTRKKQDYGYVAIVRNAKRLLLNQRIARLRPADGVVPGYLALAMQDVDYRNQFFAYETGNVGQGNVGMGAITKVPVKLPPFLEQQQIVAEVERRLSVIEELEATVQANLTRAERLRQAILHKAFKGELITQLSHTTVAPS